MDEDWALATAVPSAAKAGQLPSYRRAKALLHPLRVLNMSEFGWKIADITAAALIAFFVLLPAVVEDGFLKRLYTNNPALWTALLSASIAFIAITVGHKAIQNWRNRQLKKNHAG